MRPSHRAGGVRWLPAAAVGAVVLILAGCTAAAAPAESATPRPAPVATPDPHLTEPVTADQVFLALGAAKVGIVANNANSGGGNPNIVKMIHADVGNWPLRITEFRSTAVRKKVLAWKGGALPVRNQTPYAFAGLNVLIEYGPVGSAAAPKAPDETRQALAAKIIAALDPLLWPLDQHSVITIPARTAAPTANPPASAKPAKPAKATSPKP
jgi:hypothetical protein